MTNTINLANYGKEMSEKYGYQISIAGRLSTAEETAHKRRIRFMLDKVIGNHIPDDEEVREIDIRFYPWNRPKVTIWCKNKGFNYQNSQVHDEKFMVDGSLFRCKVDVRPF